MMGSYRTVGANQIRYSALISATLTSNSISTATTVLERDSTTPGGMALLRGTQIAVPYNGESAWRLTGGGNIGFPLAPGVLQCGIRARGAYNAVPFTRNGLPFTARSWNVQPGVDLSLTLANMLWVRGSYGFSYGRSGGTVHTGSDRMVVRHDGRLSGRWQVTDRVGVQTFASADLDPAISSTGGRQPVLWNLVLTAKVLPQRQATLSLTFEDLLNTDRTDDRRITDLYLEETRLRRFGRSVMLGFSYSWGTSEGGGATTSAGAVAPAP
jgi:hypothetical protein